MARKEKGGPFPVVMLRWPGLKARFCRRLLSTIEEVLDAKLSLVLQSDRDTIRNNTTIREGSSS